VVLSPDEFRACLDTIGWSQRNLARRLAIHHTRTERMATGRYPVPPEVATWLRVMAAFHSSHMLPDGWRLIDPIEGVPNA